MPKVKGRKTQKGDRGPTQPCSFRMIYRKYQSYFNISDEVMEWLTDHLELGEELGLTGRHTFNFYLLLLLTLSQT